MDISVEIKGQDILERNLKRMSNPREVFDADFRLAAAYSSGELKRNTPRKTGDTGRKWSAVKKLGNSAYLVENRTMTANKKYSIPVILDQGRNAISAKPGRKLYIPMSEKGRSKLAGAPIPKGFVYGKDYVLADSVKAYPGTKFIEKERRRAGEDITKRLIQRIKKEHS